MTERTPHPASSSPPEAVPPPPPTVPRAAAAAALVTSAAVLISHVACIAALGGAARPWAPGTTVADHLGLLPRWVATPLGLVVALSVVFGPVVVLICSGAAAVSLHESWRGRRRADARAAGVVVATLTLAALPLARGDELWIWILDRPGSTTGPTVRSSRTRPGP